MGPERADTLPYGVRGLTPRNNMTMIATAAMPIELITMIVV